MRFNSINLDGLPAPDVIEQLDFETILNEVVSVFLTHWAEARVKDATLPEFSAEVLESEPVMVVLEAFAAREMALRARVNDAAKAVMVALSGGTDLDNLAALFKVVRQENETDSRFKLRIQTAIEAYSCAGPEAAYIFHALDAEPTLHDATAYQPAPGKVIVTCMANSVSNPVPTEEQLAAVRDRFRQDNIKPLTDMVTVLPVEVVETEIEAVLTLYPGPSAATVLAAANASLAKLLESTRKIGFDLKRSAIISRLHQEGVHSVELIKPAVDINLGVTQAYRVTASTITVGGTDE